MGERSILVGIVEIAFDGKIFIETVKAAALEV
jgi:hypothetical protein